MLRSGVAIMTAATFCFSLMAVCIKMTATDFSTPELVFWRFAIPLPFLGWWVRRRGLSPWPRNRWVIGVRTLWGLIAISCFLWGLGRLPLADVTLLSRLQPLWVAVLAPWLLRERAEAAVWAAGLVAVAGVALLVEPSFAVGNLTGLVVLGGAAASAAAHMAVRRASADDDPWVIVLAFSILSTLIVGPLSLLSFHVPQGVQWLWLVGIGASGTLGQILLTHAYATDHAAPVAAAGYSSVLFAALWGVVIWNEIPTVNTWTGGALVVAAGILLLVQRSKGGAKTRPYAAREVTRAASSGS